MHLNYYEAEWLMKFKLREAMRRTRNGVNGVRGRRRKVRKHVEPLPVVPALRKSGSPC